MVGRHAGGDVVERDGAALETEDRVSGRRAVPHRGDPSLRTAHLALRLLSTSPRRDAVAGASSAKRPNWLYECSPHGFMVFGIARSVANLNDALRRVKGGSELVALSIGHRLYASGCLGS